MDLMYGDETRVGRDRFHGASTVLDDGGAIVVRSEADVEPGMDTLRDAALAAKKGMGQGG